MVFARFYFSVLVLIVQCFLESLIYMELALSQSYEPQAV